MTFPPAARLNGFLDRWRYVLLIALSVAFFAATAARARQKPFWHDEIYTILLSGLPSIPAMWRAAADGMDLAPPLNAFVTHALRAVTGVGPVATRLPPMIGFWGMIVLIFLIVRTRAGAMLALAGALLPFWTAAYRYSYEARGYGLMLGLFALTMYSWLRAARGERRVFCLTMFGVAVAASLWNHYYAVVTFAPIAAGEITRLAIRRRADWPLWATAAAGCAAALPLWPLASASASQTLTFWAPARTADIPAAYSFVLQPLLNRGMLNPALLIVGLAVVWMWPILGRRGHRDARWTLPAHEIAAGLVSLAIPALAVLLGVFLTGTFTLRYALPLAVSVSIVLPVVVRWLNPAGGPAEIALCLLLLWGFSGVVRHSPRDVPATVRDPLAARPLLASALSQPGPVAVGGSLQFLQYWFYTPPNLRGRLWYLADPDAAVRYTGSDTIDRGYLALSRWTPVTVQRYDEFVRRHSAFRLYTGGSGWLLPRLREEGATLELLGREPAGELYLVSIGR